MSDFTKASLLVLGFVLWLGGILVFLLTAYSSARADEVAYPGEVVMHLACVDLVATKLKVPAPALAYDESLPKPGYYTYSTITLRPGADCGVIFHEMVHHRQFRDAGIATDVHDWYKREIQASRLEIAFRSR